MDANLWLFHLQLFFGKRDFRSLNFTPGRRQSKTPILSRNVDQKSLETEFLNTICRQYGDKWQSKILFLSIFDTRSSIVDRVFYCRLPGVNLCIRWASTRQNLSSGFLTK